MRRLQASRACLFRLLSKIPTKMRVEAGVVISRTARYYGRSSWQSVYLIRVNLPSYKLQPRKAVEAHCSRADQGQKWTRVGGSIGRADGGGGGR
jgi:hypothetical protein